MFAHFIKRSNKRASACGLIGEPSLLIVKADICCRLCLLEAMSMVHLPTSVYLIAFS